MTARVAALLVTATVVAGAGSAHGDRREASVHAELVGGALTTGDADAGGATDTVSLAGLAVRSSYATHDSFQYDVAVTVLRGGSAAFASHRFTPAGRPPVDGPYQVGTVLTRLDGGVTFRLGVRWIPTARLAAGVQLRRLGAAVVDSGAGATTGRDPGLALDLVGSATIGLDHRINRRLIVGAAAGITVALPLGGAACRSLEFTIHGAYYWYPRW